VVERNRVGIGREGGGWRDERATVAHDARDAHFVEPSAKRRIFGTGVVFFGADHEEWISRVLCSTTVAVTDIAGRSIPAGIELSIDEDCQTAIGSGTCDCNMMPATIGDIRLTTNGCPFCAVIDAEHHPSIGE
jgi:hypothetical protein